MMGAGNPAETLTGPCEPPVRSFARVPKRSQIGCFTEGSLRKRLAPQAGFEPATLRLTGSRRLSILLVLRRFSSDGDLLLPGVRCQIDHKLITASPRSVGDSLAAADGRVAARSGATPSQGGRLPARRIAPSCPRTTGSCPALMQSSAAAEIAQNSGSDGIFADHRESPFQNAQCRVIYETDRGRRHRLGVRSSQITSANSR